MGKYSAASNLTVLQMEMRGFQVGNRITHEFRSNLAIEERIRAHYKDLSRPVIPVGRTQ